MPAPRTTKIVLPVIEPRSFAAVCVGLNGPPAHPGLAPKAANTTPPAPVPKAQDQAMHPDLPPTEIEVHEGEDVPLHMCDWPKPADPREIGSPQHGFLGQRIL